MKKLIYYAGIMIVAVIILPMLIVRGCSQNPGKMPDMPGEQKQQQQQISKNVQIVVYNTENDTEFETDIEEYLKGVLAAEMPAKFSIEALKAQAVAARSFAYGRLNGTYKSKEGIHDPKGLCIDPSHCQAWISKTAAMKGWGIFLAGTNWNRIERAINETRGIVAVYDGKIANTLFHSNSGGRTENSEEVWDGVSVPYLRSVASNDDKNTKDYKAVVSVKTEVVKDKLLAAYPEAKPGKNIAAGIKILDYTTGGRVKTLKIGDTSLKGTEFRSLLGLRSARFTIEKAGSDSLKITTLGYGHGVGMSQWGADALAKKGATFDEILKFYYTGIELSTIDKLGGTSGSAVK